MDSYNFSLQCLVTHLKVLRLLYFYNSGGIDCLHPVTDEMVNWARLQVSRTSTVTGCEDFDRYAKNVADTFAWVEPTDWREALEHYFVLRSLSVGNDR
jgi:hypothetical protein